MNATVCKVWKKVLNWLANQQTCSKHNGLNNFDFFKESIIPTFLTYSDCPYYSWIRKSEKKVSEYQICNYKLFLKKYSKTVISMRIEERARTQCNFLSLDFCDMEGLISWYWYSNFWIITWSWNFLPQSHLINFFMNYK